jgi:hypothetical protein
MALTPISHLFGRTSKVVLDETDVRHFVERYLAQQVGSGTVVCEEARDGRIVVRAREALVRQEIGLLEWDLRQALEREADFTLRELTVTQS